MGVEDCFFETDFGKTATIHTNEQSIPLGRLTRFERTLDPQVNHLHRPLDKTFTISAFSFSSLPTLSTNPPILSNNHFPLSLIALFPPKPSHPPETPSASEPPSVVMFLRFMSSCSYALISDSDLAMMALLYSI